MDAGGSDDARALSDILAAIRRLTGDEGVAAVNARLRELGYRRLADIESARGGPSKEGDAEGEGAFSYDALLGGGDWSRPDPAVEIDQLADAFYAAQSAAPAQDGPPPAAPIAGPAASGGGDAGRPPEALEPPDGGDLDEPSAGRDAAAPASDFDGVWRQFEDMLETAHESLGRRPSRLRRPAKRPDIDYFPRPSHLPELRVDAEPPAVAPSDARAEQDRDKEGAGLEDPVLEDPVLDNPVLEDSAPADLDTRTEPAEPADRAAPALEETAASAAAAADQAGVARETEGEAPLASAPPADSGQDQDQDQDQDQVQDQDHGHGPTPVAAAPADDRNRASEDNRKRLDRIQKLMQGAMAERRARPPRAPQPPNPVIAAMISGPTGADAPPPPEEEIDPAVEAAIGAPPSEGEPPPQSAGEPAPADLASLLRGGLRDVLTEVVREELAKARARAAAAPPPAVGPAGADDGRPDPDKT